MRTPGKLGRIISNLKQAGWSDQPADDEVGKPTKSLVTAVKTSEPVEVGLIKRQIVLGGYATEMETCLDDMFVEFSNVSRIAEELKAGFLPKAIYVCRTNVSQDEGETDNPHSPFRERKAPPIVIWRYLVNEKGVDPKEIAVYGDLKVDRKAFPLPEDFNLFSGGESDFAAFTAGSFRHIIFNLALQEGWDDPACCFAYVDKSMASPTQVEQVVGRVLRQPGAQHYADPALNSANFFIRTSGKQEFQKILDVVRKRIAGETPEVRIEGYSDPRDRARARLEPKERMVVPEIHIDADGAVQPLMDAITRIHDYTGDSVNVVGPGELTRATQQVGGIAAPLIEVISKEHSNRIVARWLVRRHMQSRYPEAVKTVDWSDAKFDARIEITSIAAGALRDAAERLVDIYLENAELTFEDSNPYLVPAVFVKPNSMVPFDNSLHDGYGDLNSDEIDIAGAIDETGLTWARNMVNGGYSIPILDKGESRRFFPDFIVWKDDKIVLIDPKGGHLLLGDAGKKLLSIRDENGRERVFVRFVTRGRWSHETMKKVGPDGWAVWRMNSTGQLRCSNQLTEKDAVAKCLDV